MKVAHLFHNPGAGDEEHSKEDLLSLMAANGFECRYSSTKKKDWKEFNQDADFFIVAGGDGTVRNLAEELFNRNVLDKTWPIALLPLGTANNIAKTLGIKGKTKDIVRSWQHPKIKKFDVGKIYDVPESNFFLESFGYGIFPYLMKEMKKQDKEEIDNPEKKMKAALKLMHKIVESYEPKYCELQVDGTDHSGKFLLAEIMNTRSIGPNLVISPLADPGDGEFEVVLVPEKHKEKFASYILDKMNGVEVNTYQFHTLKAREIKISWEGTHVHVDDKIVKMDKAEKVKIELKEGLLEFFIP